MIAVTGSTVGENGTARLLKDETVLSMSKSDQLVILGGCGITEARADVDARVKQYRDLPCSVLFIDGSTDDYDLLEEYPFFPWNGGKTRNISRGITYLARGQLFSLGGRSLLTMGGAPTPGRDDTGKYYTWWPEQDISPDDEKEAELNLLEGGWRADYVFTSDRPRGWGGPGGSEVLERLAFQTDYGSWFFAGPEDREFPDYRAVQVCDKVISLG
jgi:hypothetical protein